jgi:hypothetical protein
MSRQSRSKPLLGIVCLLILTAWTPAAGEWPLPLLLKVLLSLLCPLTLLTVAPQALRLLQRHLIQTPGR